MREEPFDVPVMVELGSVGRRQSVTYPSQAAQLLQERWPRESRGPKYRAAILACMGAMARRKAAKEARKAFIEAAREAQVLVQERTQPVFGRRVS